MRTASSSELFKSRFLFFFLWTDRRYCSHLFFAQISMELQKNSSTCKNSTRLRSQPSWRLAPERRSTFEISNRPISLSKPTLSKWQLPIWTLLTLDGVPKYHRLSDESLYRVVVDLSLHLSQVMDLVLGDCEGVSYSGCSKEECGQGPQVCSPGDRTHLASEHPPT